MKKQLFGTDGIRGKAETVINGKLAFKVGQGIAKMYDLKDVYIGYDTRKSSKVISYGIAYGLALAGIHVTIGGVVPTPVVALYSSKYNTVGVMITASHNPYTDNGIKLFKNGEKLFDEEEIELETYILNNEIKRSFVFGEITENNNILDDYYILYDQLKIGSNDFNLTYDSANGANYLVSKEVIEKYFKNSFQVANKPNGININLNCGSTYLNNIKEAVKLNKSDLGLSFDGDGDRILVVDNLNNEYDGDYILYVMAKYLKEKGKLKNNKVAVTIMTNMGVIKSLNDLEIDVIVTSVGDKLVYQAMKEHDLSIGAENSGHIIIKDFIKTGDGLLAGLYLIKILIETKTKLIDYKNEIVYYPQKLVNLENIDKNVLLDEDFIQFINSEKEALGKNSKLNIRPSGTEDLLRITISHENEEVMNKHLEKVIERIKGF